MNVPLRALCIDHEGGHGGSSRSLYLMLRELPEREAVVQVWARRESSLKNAYERAGIPCAIVPELPRFRAQKALSTTVRDVGKLMTEMWRHRKALRQLEQAVATDEFDLIHFNFESLWPLAAYLRSRTNAAFTMHMRNRPYRTPWAHLQSMAIERLIDGFIFITDNEAEAFQAVGGSWRHGTVIFNVAPSFDDAPQPHPAVPVDSRFKIASLANFAHVRGIDRIVELACELAKSGRRDFLFVLAGDSKIPAFLDGELGEIGRRGGTFADYAAAKGVSDMVLCLGHVGDPERVLASCDALVKLSRRDEPWGRDVIEALSLGRPVLATGTWSCFVETGVTGHLSCPFDARACAAQLLRWADDRSIPRALGAAGIERMKQMCDGPTNAAKLLSFWSSVAQARASATRVPRTSRLLNLT